MRGVKRVYDSYNLKDLSPADIDHLAVTNRNVSAVDLAILKTLKLLIEQGTMRTGDDERIMDHEAGHVAYHQSGKTDRFRPAVTQSAKEVIRAKINSAVHDELVANIAELRGSRNKLSSLHYTLSLSTQDTAADPQYALSARWLVQTMIEQIKTNPDHFGINQSTAGGLSVEEQIVLALPKLCDHTVLLNELMDAVKARYDVECMELDFGAEGGEAMLPSLKLGERITAQRDQLTKRALGGAMLATGLHLLAQRIFGPQKPKAN